MEKGLKLIFLILAWCTSLSEASVSCMDNAGNPVDWFIAYKLPRLHNDPRPLVAQGLGHFYMDVNHQEWTLSDKSLNGSGHAIYNTMQHVYKNYKSKDVAYLLYNDEIPDGPTSFDHGHTKGDVVFDSESGFWLVHSLPHFPNMANTSYGYPHTGLVYGQTFLCVTFPAKFFDQIGTQMLYNWPQVYDFNLPADLAKVNPNIEKVTQGQHVKAAPWNHQTELVSKAGTTFISFAKFTDWNADLYDAWVAPYFQSPMFTETWQNGQGKLPSNCSAKYKVYNIKYMQIKDVPFKETKDHAKWGVTATKQWICIGDINRAETQALRAGGTLCSKLPAVWTAFNSSITHLESCSPPRWGKYNLKDASKYNLKDASKYNLKDASKYNLKDARKYKPNLLLV